MFTLRAEIAASLVAVSLLGLLVGWMMQRALSSRRLLDADAAWNARYVELERSCGVVEAVCLCHQIDLFCSLLFCLLTPDPFDGQQRGLAVIGGSGELVQRGGVGDVRQLGEQCGAFSLEFDSFGERCSP